jgi:uncharacterized membrane protein
MTRRSDELSAVARASSNREATVRSSAIPRLDVVDVVRGIAIAGVVLFHLVWDLAFLGVIPAWIASHPLWLLFGRVLAGTFMALVGVSLVLASANGFKRRAFLRRLAVLVAAALAITLVTRAAFPETFVYYGILHAIAVASLVGALALRLPTVAIAALGFMAYALGFAWTSSAFEPRWLAWTGFAAAPPPSNDLVPVFPWAGLTLLGMAAARLALAWGWVHRTKPTDGRAARWLAWLGRHSLAIYLVHQPVLLGVLIPLVGLVR